jgi:hypothetical protein
MPKACASRAQKLDLTCGTGVIRRSMPFMGRFLPGLGPRNAAFFLRKSQVPRRLHFSTSVFCAFWPTLAKIARESLEEGLPVCKDNLHSPW